MSTIHEIRGEVRPVHIPTSPVVREGEDRNAAGPTIPAADLHARRIAREAEGWFRLADERGRMRPDAVLAKALDATAFSVRHRTHSLAVPSKLQGTAACQGALWRLVRERVPFGAPLDVVEDGVALVVSTDGERLGLVQPKHAPWLRPLVPFGAAVYLGRVTGHEREKYSLGLNVVFGGVGAALDRLRHALGETAAAIEVGPAGDGGAVGDVVLWREPDGTARASVPHIVRHSPTGLEWGYNGSGPADLARSVLLAFADEATADRLHVAYKDEVVAHVPEHGGVIRAADIRAWLAAEEAPRPAA